MNMVKELSRFEMAIIKRTAQNTKSLRAKRDKLIKKVLASQAELNIIKESIEKFEAPIRSMTGGYTSEEVLNNSFMNGTEYMNNTESAGIIPENCESLSEVSDSTVEEQIDCESEQ